MIPGIIWTSNYQWTSDEYKEKINLLQKNMASQNLLDYFAIQ